MEEMYLAYYGEFIDRKGAAWRVEIRKLWDGSYPKPTDDDAAEVFFPAGSPLTIEWSRTDKYNPMQPSNATLKLISDTDREFVGLYAVKPGAVRMDVLFRLGNDGGWSLYWSGSLDTELYEEPYSYSSGYEVSLTFADFAVLSRVDFNLSGIVSYWDIITECLKVSGIRYSNTIVSAGLKIQEGNWQIGSTTINSDNFYDEEGVPMSMREVLESILQPLALRMIQRDGAVYIYDLANRYTASALPVEWTDTDAVLSVDKVYRKVSVECSPYGTAEALKINIDTADDLAQASGLLVYTDLNPADKLQGFNMYYGEGLKAESGLYLPADGQYCRFRPVYSGEDTAAVLWGARAGNVGMAADNASEQIRLIGKAPGLPSSAASYGPGYPVSTGMVFRCPRVFLSSDYCRLRISLELLFDVRYNPFEPESFYNEEGNYKNMTDWCNLGYVPITLEFFDTDGVIVGHYENGHLLESDTYLGAGRWVEGYAAPGNAWLSYYDPDDRRSSTGFGGWQKNRQTIGFYQNSFLPDRFTRMEQGEYVDSPACFFEKSGYLELTVLAGVLQLDYSRVCRNIYPFVRWLAYRNPVIRLVDNNGLDLKLSDYEDKAWVNRDASEELNLRLTTCTEGPATARARVYYNGAPLRKVTRNGYTDTPERLLLGTVFSQYSKGCAVLSGTAGRLSGLGPYSDAATEGKFIMLSETFDVRAAESRIEIAQLEGDDYMAAEYE